MIRAAAEADGAVHDRERVQDGEDALDAARQVDEAFITAQKEPIPNGENEDWCAISTRDLMDNPEAE